MLEVAVIALMMPGVQGRPQNAVFLFDGSDTSAWIQRKDKSPCKWKVENGELVVDPAQSDIITKREFGNYRLHMEFCLPLEPDRKDQARANSGLYNQGRYEIQILDNWNNTTYATGGCGALYGQKDPDKDAIRPPGWWNSYDILLTSAKLDVDGKLLAKPRITVWHNGIKVHNDVEIQNPQTTAGIDGPWVAKGPILLQNHGSLVRFRNVWIVEL